MIPWYMLQRHSVVQAPHLFITVLSLVPSPKFFATQNATERKSEKLGLVSTARVLVCMSSLLPNCNLQYNILQYFLCSSGFIRFTLSMAHFCEAVSYALRCINREQEEALHHLYQGKDVFAWIPTGYGKSICYQLLPFMYGYKRGCSSSSPRCSVALILHSTARVLLHKTEPSTTWNGWNLNYTESIARCYTEDCNLVIVNSCALKPLQWRPGPIFRVFVLLRKILAWGRG